MDNVLKKDGTGRIIWLDAARCLAIVSISLNHAVGRSYAVYENAWLEFGSIPLWSTLFKTVVYVFSRLGVPLFLMITGALILKKRIETADDVKRFYKKSYLPLFITSEIWMALFFAALVVSNPYSRHQSLILTLKFFICTMLQIEPLTMGSMWYIPMILCLYLFLPFMAMLKGRINGKVLYPVGGAVLFYCFLLPTANLFLQAIGHSTFSKASDIILLSEYALYAVVGYFISTGCMAKIKTVWVALGAAISFVLSVLTQLFFFHSTAEVTVRYDFIGTLICSVFLFEWLRRTFAQVKRGAGAFTALSRMAFGIYFVHILIMKTLCMAQFSAVRAVLPQPVFLLYLELVSFLGSVVVVWLLSKIPHVGKVLFLYK